MGIATLSLKQEYWDEFEVRDDDLEFLYNHLLEIETPLTPDELVQVLVKERVDHEKKILEDNKNEAGAVYLPKGKIFIWPDDSISAIGLAARNCYQYTPR